MANLDDPGQGGSANGSADAATSRPADPRARELELENARLRAELAEAKDDVQSLRRALRTVAPEYDITEAEMRAVMDHPVPFQDAVADVERMLGAVGAK